MLAALNRELARLEEELAQCKTGMDARATTAALRQVTRLLISLLIMAKVFKNCLGFTA
jgi:hypothetical protein